MSNQTPELKTKENSIIIPFTKKTDFRTGFVLLFFSIFVIIESAKMPDKMPGVDFGPSIMPYWLGVLLAVFSVVLMLQSLSVKNTTHSIIKRQELKPVIILFLVLVIYLALMEVIGFGLDTFLLVSLLTRKLGKYHYWKCVLLGAITGTLTAYLFRTLLGLPLPIGILGF